nr:hypothetical protein [Rhizobium leguminosarum]
MKWQLSNGYGKRSLIEKAIGDKSPSSGGDSGQSRPGRETEGVIGCRSQSHA